MPHHAPLIGTIVAALVAAFLMGALAHRLRVSPIAGYLLAGVLVGPFTPGFVADAELAAELAELGVILLMFGVGLHFSLKDLLSVRKIALPGAIVQILVAVLLGLALSLTIGWSVLTGILFGLALSVASTVVLLRALETRGLVQTERGRIAIGWLIVEDLVMVLTLVLLPVLASMQSGNVSGQELTILFLITCLKVAGFVAFMLLVGKRIIPAALHWVVHTGSRELFRLSVLAIALGVAAGAALVFDVSFALGAFFAGMILGETPLSRRAAEETLPLRDAFAVLFFVSVGMLFDPAVVLEQPLLLLATVAIIVFGKSIAAYGIVRMFGYDNRTSLTVAASLAQIGEFSFILAGLGVSLQILPEAGRDLILAGAILSILLHPFLFTAVSGLAIKKSLLPSQQPQSGAEASPITRHYIVVGLGRVGSLLVEELLRRKTTFTVIEEGLDVISASTLDPAHVIHGNANDESTLIEAGIARAHLLFLAIPEGFEAGSIAVRARKLNTGVKVFARAHSTDEVKHLEKLGVNKVVMGEEEIAKAMIASAAA